MIDETARNNSSGLHLCGSRGNENGRQPAPESENPPRKLRILFVDDDDDLSRVVKMMLERLSHHVTTRRNPFDALAELTHGKKRCDVLITDMTMPGMTGIDLARELSLTLPDLPIILSTGFGELVDEDKSNTAGIRHILTKPFGMQELARAILEVANGEPEAKESA